MINFRAIFSGRYFALILGIALSGGLLFFLFKDIDLEQFYREFSKVRIWVAVPLFLLFLGSLFIRALRWKLLLPASYRESLKIRDLAEATLIGFAASGVLPLRAGEIARPLYLRRIANVPFATGLTSVLTERVFDLVSLVAVSCIAISSIDSLPDSAEPPDFLFKSAYALGTIALIGVAGLVLCATAGQFTLRLGKYLLEKVFPQSVAAKLLTILNQIVETLGSLRSVRELLLIIFYSFVIWLLSALFFQVALSLFDEEMRFSVGLLISVAVAFAVAAPSSPGFIGTFQFGCALALTTVYKYPKEFSLAYGFTVHIIQTLCLILPAAFVISRRGFSVRSTVSNVSNEA